MRTLRIIFALILLLPAIAGAQATRPSQFDSVALRRSSPPAIAPGASAPVPSGGIEMIRVLGALAIVIGLILIFRWGAKRWFNLPTTGAANRSVKVLGRTMIAPRQHVLLLQVGRRVIVASDSGGTISPLAQITDADEVAELVGQMQSQATTPPRKFGPLFGKAQSNFDDVTEKETDRQSDEASLAATQVELGGLMEKVRSISQQMKA